MIRRVLRDHWSLEKAEDEARKIGMRSPNLREFALDYIRRQQKPSQCSTAITAVSATFAAVADKSPDTGISRFDDSSRALARPVARLPQSL